MNTVAILTGPDTHLDHLGVLSALIDVPLLVTDEKNHLLAQIFYPDLQVELKRFDELTMDYLVRHFDVIMESGKFFATELGPFMQLLYGKKMRFVFCPHGNSDKGHSLNCHVDQDISLVYGEHLHDLLKKSGAAEKIRHIIRTGNYRLPYYLSHQKFYDDLAKQHVFSHFASDKPVILYAPTWSDHENPTSFFLATSQLIEELCPIYNVLIKLHPLLVDAHPAHVFSVTSRYDRHPSAIFLQDFPPIYPLLSQCSVYIGDYSSMGYDFLYFDKPLYFLNPKKSKTVSPLQTCGIEIPLDGGVRLVDFFKNNPNAL